IVRRGKKRRNQRCARINKRQFVPRKRLTCEIVDERNQVAMTVKILRVVACFLKIRRHRRGRRLTLPVAQSFVIPKEKCPVSPARSADRPAKLVALQRLYAWRKKTLCIHRVIPQELPR